MEKLVALFIIITLLFNSCSNDNSENIDLIGKWRLIEVLADPGDGSGVFRSVNSSKTLEFFADGTVKSNGSLCYMNTGTQQEGEGTYSLEKGLIRPKNCTINGINVTISYKIEGPDLILSYFCIEPCREKFIKI